MAYQNHPHLIKSLHRYSTKYYRKLFYEIILIWNNPIQSFDINSLLYAINHGASMKLPIIIYQQSINSLSNRWLLSNYHQFSTKSVIFIDDDSAFTKYCFECLFHIWLNNMDKVIGPGYSQKRYFAIDLNAYDTNNTKYMYVFKPNKANHFEMLLPTGITFDIKYLDQISNIFIKYNLIQIIDEQSAHCDDIAMILSLSKLFEGKEFLIALENLKITMTTSRDKYQKPIYGSSTIEQRFNDRSECLNMIKNRLEDSKYENIIIQHNATTNMIDCYQNPYFCLTKKACKHHNYHNGSTISKKVNKIHGQSRDRLNHNDRKRRNNGPYHNNLNDYNTDKDQLWSIRKATKRNRMKRKTNQNKYKGYNGQNNNKYDRKRKWGSMKGLHYK